MTASIPLTISIVGKSGCGKTTFLEALIPDLAARGYRIATIEHLSHSGVDMEQPGKDTWRHYQAGADVVAVVAPDKIAIVHRLEGELSLEEIACHIAASASVDLILTEGYRHDDAVKIEVVRAACSDEALCAPGELLAIVSDVPPDKLPQGPPVFPLDAVNEAADYVECHLIRQRATRAKGRHDPASLDGHNQGTT